MNIELTPDHAISTLKVTDMGLAEKTHAHDWKKTENDAHGSWTEWICACGARVTCEGRDT